jgi:hypothetical protein
MYERLPGFLAAGTVPAAIACREPAKQEALGGAAAGQPPSEQTRRKDACVVGDKQVPWAQQARKIGKVAIGDRTTSAIEDEQT